MSQFSTDVDNLEAATSSTVVTLADGDSYALRISPVVKEVGPDRLRMLAYNGSIPGPTLRVPEGSTVTVEVRNDGDTDATVHWHGLRVENAFDGVPGLTQPPIPGGGSFHYQLHVPDPGLYWYHPHLREDYGLELGLYGNVLVDPREPDYWPPADRELILTLDDLLIEDGRLVTFETAGPTHVAMGRYGNVMLTAGESEPAFEARAGEVVRLYLTNTANARQFQIAVPGAQLKLVGGDSGRYERETFVDGVLLAPSERAIVDVLFERPGRFALQNQTPTRADDLATIAVADAPAPTDATAFAMLRRNAEFDTLRAALPALHAKLPDKTLRIASHYVHADKPAPADEHHHVEHHHDDSPDGVEWEDLRPDLNQLTTAETMRWELVDADTGAVNEAIDWTFHVGDQIKLRVVNDPAQDHRMQHPFHVHGAGRFAVIARDDVLESNLVWKDTVLVRSNETVDLLLDVTNAGRWMAHCHIAEHNQAGMMFFFTVDPTPR